MAGRRPALAVWALLALAGCGRDYERVELARVVEPFTPQAPPPGETVQALPPLKDQPLEPDTSDGSIAMRIDRYRFWLRNRCDFPPYEPRRTQVAATDGLAAVIVGIRQDMLSITRLLDEVSAPVDQGSQEREERLRPAVLLRPEEWTGLSVRLLDLAGAMDSWAAAAGAAAPAPSPDNREGKAGKPVTGWGQAMHDRVHAFQDAANDLAAEPALHLQEGSALQGRLAGIARIATSLLDACWEERPCSVMPLLRRVERALDAVEGDPAWAHLFGHDAASTPLQRNHLRSRLVRVRQALVGVAAWWTAQRATLLECQPEPTLVYPAVSMD